MTKTIRFEFYPLVKLRVTEIYCDPLRVDGNADFYLLLISTVYWQRECLGSFIVVHSLSGSHVVDQAASWCV